MICIYQVIPGASQKNPDLVTNSGPIPDHFWHLGPDPDQVRNSGPYWSHCIWSVLVLPQKHKSKSFKFEKEKIHYSFNGELDYPPGGSNVPSRHAAVWASDESGVLSRLSRGFGRRTRLKPGSASSERTSPESSGAGSVTVSGDQGL